MGYEGQVPDRFGFLQGFPPKLLGVAEFFLSEKQKMRFVAKFEKFNTDYEWVTSLRYSVFLADCPELLLRGPTHLSITADFKMSEFKVTDKIPEEVQKHMKDFYVDVTPGFFDLRGSTTQIYILCENYYSDSTLINEAVSCIKKLPIEYYFANDPENLKKLYEVIKDSYSKIIADQEARWALQFNTAKV